MSESNNKVKQPRAWLGWAVFAVTSVAVLGLTLLGASIMERRHQAITATEVLCPTGEFESDPEKWKVNYPRQYDSYKRMKQTDSETKYGGSAHRDYLEESPDKVILFAGMSFSKEYNQARGHYYSRKDIMDTTRISPNSPATCWTCKSSDVPKKMAELGKKRLDSQQADFQELVMAGAADFYADNFHDMASDIDHPIGCLDCHDPKTMQLRITRPALIEGLAAAGRDLNDISHQEMRSLVCAQCHNEYYFKGEGNYLTLPWSEGMTVEGIEKHYDRVGFTDWVHGISGTDMLKMQHPDYELYSQGIHAFRDVACADCHMPYRTEGGAKFTDHHVKSPLLNVENSCQVCHRWSEKEIITRVESIQDKVREGRTRAENAISRAHFDVAACMQAGADDEELKKVRGLIRTAQMRWDYVAANNGMGFHAPQEAMRILAAAIELAQEARIDASKILARYGYTDQVRYPDYSTKEKAQQLLKLFEKGTAPNLLPEKKN